MEHIYRIAKGSVIKIGGIPVVINASITFSCNTDLSPFNMAEIVDPRKLSEEGIYVPMNPRTSENENDWKMVDECRNMIEENKKQQP